MARLARLLYREGEHAHRTPEGSAGVDRGRARHAGIADDSGADPAAPGAARADHLAVQRGAGQYRGRTETAHAGADDREVAGRGRSGADRLDGLYDEPRPGAPRTITDTEVERVVIRTLETTPRGQTHWSLRGMANATGLSRMTISRIWHAFGLQPHRTESFKL